MSHHHVCLSTIWNMFFLNACVFIFTRWKVNLDIVLILVLLDLFEYLLTAKLTNLVPTTVHLCREKPSTGNPTLDLNRPNLTIWYHSAAAWRKLSWFCIILGRLEKSQDISVSRSEAAYHFLLNIWATTMVLNFSAAPRRLNSSWIKLIVHVAFLLFCCEGSVVMNVSSLLLPSARIW